MGCFLRLLWRRRGDAGRPPKAMEEAAGISVIVASVDLIAFVVFDPALQPPPLSEDKEYF